ncbi:MscS Mechanosensitive ion channel [Solidesulfovibrio fructosivorans JJ]]|uniref:MscS Mechanosensitive ion channel n=1 Tax=Solidesulfovibrio fructosivorans JJ] TaxID=596151 RepID=E1K210_SOLFR|nr:mechanosensitive ion channel domain-containing protein [Solidesulfovibrio fructosivorans]EFL49368.1 MscS Mechanosensitive ion channel [Solidesulfovibrio fructosivorans JJ]]
MLGDAAKFFALTTVLALCMLVTDVGPCFSRTGEPAQVMLLAAAPVKHVIKSGDTISLLAQRYGVSVAAILKANPGLEPSRLQLGRAILIPAGGQSAQPGKLPGIPTLPDGPPESVELRPEKAPQATQPLKEHALTDGKAPSATAPAPAAAQPAPAQSAGAAAPAAATPEAAASPTDAAKGAVDKTVAALKDNAAAAVPVAMETVGGRTRLSVGGKAFFADQIVPLALSLGSKIMSALLLFAAGVWVSGRVAALLVRVLRGRKVPQEVLSFAGSLTRYGLYLVVVIATLGQLGFNVSSLLALFGAAGLAVSLALKDTLSNFASGVMLLLFRFFRVGDRVSVPGASGAAGIVTDIDVFNTVIRSDTGETIIVPNSKIAGNVIVVTPSGVKEKEDLEEKED